MVQAFQIRRAVGVLFHPEIDRDTIGALIDRNAQRLRGEGFAPDEIMAEWTRLPDDLVSRSESLLRSLIQRCGRNL